MSILELRDVTKRFGDIVAVDAVSFDVAEGATISLLGPSGCGKTTTLRLIAGFEQPDEGAVVISGEDMRGKRPYERNVGLLFQDYALFPHMSVADNVAYGLRHRGVEKQAIPGRTAEMLKLVKLMGLDTRMPRQLSGGQQQRVALARALATEPSVVLLDEPLSALDAKLRQELRVELKEILALARTTSIVVTHDQDEAMSLAEHIIVMNEGRIMQQGSPEEIYARPQNKFVAEFIGRSNWFEGRFGGEAGPGCRLFETSDDVRLKVAAAKADGALEVGVRPERIRVEPAGGSVPAEGPDNVLPGTVVSTLYLGSDMHLWVRLASGRQVHAVEQNRGQSLVGDGAPVALRFRPEDCIVVPAARGAGSEEGVE